MLLSYFSNFTSKQPKESTLPDIINIIRTDDRLRSITESYRLTKEKRIKESSSLFGVAARFSGGKALANITSLTGLSLVDIDHIKDETGAVIDNLRSVIKADPHTVLCYSTISGKGLRILFRYELDKRYELRQQISFYTKAFIAGNAYYEQLLGVETDGQCKNVGRLSCLSYDPEVYYNADALAFTQAEIEAAWQPRQQAQKAERKRKREWKRMQVCYEQCIRPEVEAEGAVFAPGRHNDYVMRVGYKLNAFGFDEDVAVAWASELFADYDKTAEVIHACYTHTEEHGSRTQHHGRSGKEGGNATQSSKPWAAVDDIQQFLTEHVHLRHNMITSRVEYKTECETSEIWEPITDRVMNSLWAEMSATYRVNIQDMYRVVESIFVPTFHPFKAYLDEVKARSARKGISPNDAEVPSAITVLASTVKVRGDELAQRLFESYLRKWLVGMVAAWVDPTVVNNVILVLIGEQGSYKTTWFQYLLPPELRRYFYTKTNANRLGRDDLLALAQYGLVCCEELDTMRPTELNQLKAVVTMSSIDERAAYAHFHEHRPHIASFCGTGNNAQFLSDPTGNRRWLPFEVVDIRSPREHPFDYEAIYAEAYSLYLSGFQFWFSKEEITLLSEHNRYFETPRLEAELVQQYFRIPMNGEQGEFMSVAIALQIISGNISQKLSAVYVGRAFKEMGFEQKVVKHVRGYIVVRYSAEEMQHRRLLAAKL